MILIIHKNRKPAEEISDMFHYMGVLSTPATPLEALSVVSIEFRAILIVSPELLPDIGEFVSRLRRYTFNTPIYGLTDDPTDAQVKDFGLDRVFQNRGYSSTLLTEISRHCREIGASIVGIYMLAGIDASCDKRHVTFMDKPIPFTKTEAMILRYLIASYPNPKSAEQILEFAFKKGKRPEPSAIRTHISIMNRKYRSYTDRTLILSLTKRGYAVATPEMIREGKVEMSVASV